MGMHPLMRVLSSEINLQILGVLRSGSFHPRELAQILQRDESDVSRRLKNLERLGLVEGRWVHASGRNIRVYSLKVGEVNIHFEPGEVRIEAKGKTSYKFPIRWERRPDVNLFVGRNREINVLRRSSGVIVVHGIAGIGKTTLVAWTFPGAYWYSITGMEEFEYLTWQLGLFLNSLEWPDLMDYLQGGGRREGDVLELILKGLESTGGTIVIDDLHMCRDERVSRMLSYLARRLKGGRIVVTTRLKPNLGTEGVTYIHLRGLKPKEAYQLARLKGKKITPGEFAELYGLTLGHPLTLNLLLETHGVQESDKERLFDFLFSEIYQQLSEGEKRMLSILGLFDESIEYDALKELYRERSIFTVLHSLRRRGLVERVGEHYSLHEMIRGFAREMSGSNREQCYLRYSEYLLKKAAPREFLMALKYIIKAEARDRIKDLVFLRIRKLRRVIMDFPKAYLRLLLEVADDPYAKLEIGVIYFQKGLFGKAMRLWLEAEPYLTGVFKVKVKSLLSSVCMEFGDLGCVREYLKEIKSLAEGLDDTYAWLLYYSEKTKYEFYRDNLTEALESSFKELELVKALGDIEEEPHILFHIGDTYLEMGKARKAIEYYRNALDLSRVYGVHFREHVAYTELAKAYYEVGKYEQAVGYATKSAEYFLRIRSYRRAVGTLPYRCVSYIGLGNLDSAEEDARELIRIAQSTGYPPAWIGYILLGVVEELRGGDGKEYFEIAWEHLRGHEWIYRTVIKGLRKVFETSVIEAKVNGLNSQRAG